MAQEGFSQATGRTHRTLTDQHGQKWSADIEKKTDHPCGPIAPKFNAPLAVPQKYLKMVAGDSGRIRIDYDQWLQDLDEEWAYYESRKRELAIQIAPSRAAEEYENPSPLLLSQLGKIPQAKEPVLARKAGNPWVRGIVGAIMPEEAKPYFEKPEEAKDVAWGGAQEAPLTSAFPVYSGGYWICTNTRKFKDKDEAVRVQQEIDAGTAEEWRVAS